MSHKQTLPVPKIAAGKIAADCTARYGFVSAWHQFQDWAHKMMEDGADHVLAVPHLALGTAP
jgi:hypothetical protein